jgi:hypothetical protein
MLGCVYGGLGIVQAVQSTLNKVWGLPRDSRPDPVTVTGGAYGVGRGPGRGCLVPG